MTFYFANDVLWKIDTKRNFKGKLNKITLIRQY